MFSTKINLQPFVNLFRAVTLLVGVLTPNQRSLAYRTYGYFGLFIFCVFNSTLMVVNLIFFTALSEIVTPLWTTLELTCVMIKSLHFYYYNVEVMALIDRLDTFILEDNCECALMHKFIHGMKYITVTTSVCAFCAINAYTVMLISISVEPVIAFPAWLPFLDWKHKTLDFWIATVFSHVSVHYSALLLMSIDFIVIFMMCVVSVQIEIIGKRLAVIGVHAKQTNENVHKSTQRLIQCIRLHKDALEFTDNVGQLFSMPWMLQFFSSTLVISAVITEVSKVNGHFIQYIQYI